MPQGEKEEGRPRKVTRPLFLRSSTAWITQARAALLREGWPGIDTLTRR